MQIFVNLVERLNSPVYSEPPCTTKALLPTDSHKTEVLNKIQNKLSVPLNMETFVRNSSYICRLRIVLPCNNRQCLFARTLLPRSNCSLFTVRALKCSDDSSFPSVTGQRMIFGQSFHGFVRTGIWPPSPSFIHKMAVNHCCLCVCMHRTCW